MIKILTAADHAIVRKGRKQILSQTPDMVVVAEASNGQEALDKLVGNNIDLIVLDISMPGKGGLDVLSEIRSKRHELPVLILSMYPGEHYADRVLKVGASGYLTKDSVPDELISAIRQISQGGKYISPSLAEKATLG